MLMTTQTQKAAQAEFKPDFLYLKGQKKRIVDFIEEHGSITQAQAWKYIHCSKLSTRIGEIERRCGYVFNREKEATEETFFLRYSFAGNLGAESYRLPTSEEIVRIMRQKGVIEKKSADS